MDEPRPRGWYCLNWTLLWSSGIVRSLPDILIDAFYYETPDDFIEWEDDPRKPSGRYDWGDTYDIDEDERKDEDGLFVAEHILSLGR